MGCHWWLKLGPVTGIDIEDFGKGDTPLHCAINKQDLMTFKALLDAGADVNLANNWVNKKSLRAV